MNVYIVTKSNCRGHVIDRVFLKRSDAIKYRDAKKKTARQYLWWVITTKKAV